MQTAPVRNLHKTMRVTDEILERYRTQSAAFMSPDQAGARRFYRSQHRTEIAVLKCMDGRLNLALMTNTPPGILSPFRTMGGKFNMGWPWFGDLIDEWVKHAWEKQRSAVILVTYHFSRSHNSHLGCKGWGYDQAAAQDAAHALVNDIGRIYGVGHDGVRAIVVGIETDEDALVFHGNGTLDLAQEADTAEFELLEKFRVLFPGMGLQVLSDVFELVKGNIAHIAEIRAKKREPIDMDHRENIIGVGRGFDSLHMPNRALIIGPFDHGWPNEVAVAGKIVKSNLEAGRINVEDGFLLLCSSAFRKDRGTGLERHRSEFRAKEIAKYAQKALTEAVPDLTFDVVIGTVDMDTRELYVLERS